MSVRLLRVEDPADRQLWRDLWDEHAHADAFAHPNYCGLVEPAGLGCLLWQGEGWGAFLPVTTRTVPEVADLGGDFVDAFGVYGFNAPVLWGDAEAATAFRAELQEHCRRTGIVSLFLRLPPGVDLSAHFPEGAVAPLREIVVLRLDREPDDVWAGYDRKVRKNVRRARREGLSFSITDSRDEVGDAYAIYEQTMRRRAAAARYDFTPTFFEDMVDRVPGAHLATVRSAADDLLSVELVVRAGDAVYSMFGGTTEAGMSVRANDLLKHELAMWAIAQGFSSYVLGGGKEPADGIFRYKAAFDPGGVQEMQAVRAVFDDEVYAILQEGWRTARGRLGPGFPSYRP